VAIHRGETAVYIDYGAATGLRHRQGFGNAATLSIAIISGLAVRLPLILVLMPVLE
jgi:hypothetical protein